MKRSEKRELEIEHEVLKILSMNARASFNFIGNKIGTSAQQAYRIVKRLEKKYGIKYLAEINVEKLGFIKFLVLVKFLDSSPTEKEVKEIFDREPRIQVAMMLSGKNYDLLLYILVKNNEDIEGLRIDLTNNTALNNYPLRLYFTPFYEGYNFVPLRDEFVDMLREQVISQKTAQKYPVIKEKQQIMLKREFAILKEWNIDGSLDLREIDRKYGFDKGRAQYAYYRLLQSGLIKRLTITMTRIPVKYISMLSIEVFGFNKFYSTRKRMFLDIVSEQNTPPNRYILIGDVGSPFSVLLFLPVFEGGDTETVATILSRIKGINIATHVITKLYGRLCFRRFDNTYSMQAETLAKNYNYVLPKKINYLGKE